MRAFNRYLLVILLGMAGARLAYWRERNEASFALCGDLEHTPGRLVGSVARLPSGYWEMIDPRWEALGAQVRFFGDVWLDRSVVGQSPQFGREVEVAGAFRCLSRRRNPGRLEDGWHIWQVPRILIHGPRFRTRLVPTTANWGARLQHRFEAWLERLFSRFPGWRALEREVWMGDTSGFPPDVLAFYREGGLLHLLSLSGQRVAALVLLCLLVARVLLRIARTLRIWCWVAPLYRYVYRGLPLACCGLLYVTSHAVGPLRRTLAMAAAVWLLRWRCLETSALQLTTSSVACLLIWEPQLLSSTGFFLSVMATVLLCRFCQEGRFRRRAVDYLVTSTVMPILVFPLSAFLFAKVSWLAPIHSLVLSWSWSLVFVPLAFLAPFLMAVLPERCGAVFGRFLEWAWTSFLSFQQSWSQWVGAVYRSSIRPTWLEMLLMEGACLLLFLMLRGYIFPAFEEEEDLY